MRKNVGTLDASIRITAGLMGLAYSIGRMARRPYRTPWLLMGMSAMTVAEGITRFCPMLYALGLSTRSRDRARANGTAEAIGPSPAAAGRKQPVQAAAAPSPPAEAGGQHQVSNTERTRDDATRGIIRPRRARKLPKRPSTAYRQAEHHHPTYS